MAVEGVTAVLWFRRSRRRGAHAAAPSGDHQPRHAAADDTTQAAALRRREQDELARLNAERPAVTDLAGLLREQTERNHFAELISAAFGGRAPWGRDAPPQ